MPIPPILPILPVEAVKQLALPRASADEQVALLVAGVNYPRVSQANKNPDQVAPTFFDLAKNLKDHILAKGLAERVLIYHFLEGQILDFRRGGPKDGTALGPALDKLVMSNYRSWLNDGGGEILTLKGQGTPRFYFPGVSELAASESGDAKADVSMSDYDPWPEGDMRERGLSIAHVYTTIAGSAAGSIRGLHFIGHAWGGAPVIVNTIDKGGTWNSKQFDRDPRSRDFTNPRLGGIFSGQSLQAFGAAFTDDAEITIWGCDADRCAQLLILQAGARSTTAIKAPKDAQQCQAVLDDSVGRERARLAAMIATEYPSRLAARATTRVFAAYPGTGAEDDRSDKTVRFTPTVMHIRFPDHAQQLKFYKANGFAFANTGMHRADAGVPAGLEGVGRGYGVYGP